MTQPSLQEGEPKRFYITELRILGRSIPVNPPIEVDEPFELYILGTEQAPKISYSYTVRIRE